MSEQERLTKLVKKFTEQRLSKRKKGDPPTEVFVDFVNGNLILSDNKKAHDEAVASSKRSFGFNGLLNKCPDKIEPDLNKELNDITARLTKKWPNHYE